MNSVKKFLSLEEKIKKSKFDYIGKLKWFLIAPILLMIVGIILLSTIGFNTGIDFTGGTIIQVIPEGQDMANAAIYNEVKAKVDGVLEANGITASMYQTTDTDFGIALTVRYKDKEGLTDSEMNDLNEKITTELFDAFGFDKLAQSNLISGNQRIGATASSELLMNAILALLVAVALILIYIIFRFEFTSGMSTVLTIFHDVLITVSLMLIFRIQVNSSFIAAIITIVGYSINNTIIIFDRIRENASQTKFLESSNAAIANASIKDTISRSINTTLTTFITIAMVAIIGVDSIREFALPILMGIAVGFYSSIFIAPALWVIAYKKSDKKKFAWLRGGDERNRKAEKKTLNGQV